MLRLALSTLEKSILDDIEEIGFGELYRVPGTGDTYPCQMATLSEKAVAMVKFLRKETTVKKIVIHEGEPSLAEVFTKTQNGRTCLKKIKF